LTVYRKDRNQKLRGSLAFKIIHVHLTKQKSIKQAKLNQLNISGGLPGGEMPHNTVLGTALRLTIIHLPKAGQNSDY